PLLFGNCLATSTVVVDGGVLGVERFDVTLAVASDYDMWSRLVVRAKAMCMPDALVSYRTHSANVTQARAAQAEACLERIARRSIARLGLDASDAELQFHRRIGSHRLDGSDACLCGVAAWLANLARANGATQVYAGSPFRRAVAMEWMDASELAA